MDSPYRSLRLELKDHVAEVVLTGPGKGNAMGPATWTELPRLFAALDRDEAVRAIIIRGEGDNFCFGLDLKAMMADLGPLLAGDAMAAARTKLHDLILDMQQANDRVAWCRKPVIAAVSGWCIGAGVDLISACDIRLASADARFSVREVKLAIVADMGSLQRLPRIIGAGLARELAFTGNDLDAARAQRIGLCNDVHPTRDALLEAARAMAGQIAKNPPLVVQGIKQVMNYCEDKSAADGERFVAVWNSAFLASQDLGEAFSAFVERRPAQFKGE